MRRYFTQSWLLSGALGAAALLGGTPVTAQPAPLPRPTLSFAPAAPPQMFTISSGRQVIEVPAGQNVQSAGGIAQPLPPVVAPAAAPSPTPPAALPLQFVSAPAPGPRPTFPRAEPEPRRKSYIDLTAAPCFSHAANYTWIVGQLEYSNISKQWRLRYTSVDETDRYGGRVTLMESQHVGQLRDGMYVRVRGYLVNPESAGSQPTYYRIESFDTVANPNADPAPPAPR